MKEQITAYEQAYNASSDVVKQERNTSYEDVFTWQIWDDAQPQFSHAAQEAVKSIFEVFTWGLKSPLEFCLFMDDLRHLVNGMKWTSINRDDAVNAMSQAIGPWSVRSFKDISLAFWMGMVWDDDMTLA